MNKLIMNLRHLCDCYEDMDTITTYFQSGNGSGLMLPGTHIPKNVTKVIDEQQTQITRLEAVIDRQGIELQALKDAATHPVRKMMDDVESGKAKFGGGGGDVQKG